MLPDVVPAVITEGPFIGQGGTEKAMRRLARALPQFQWRYEVLAPRRIVREIERRDGVCALGVARVPEREPLMLFNNRPMAVPGYGLILRKDRLAEFRPLLDADGAVDLDRLAAAKRLTGGYFAGRPMPPPLAGFIEGKRGRLSSDSDSTRLFRQLGAKRLDYLFTQRDEARYFAAVMGKETRFVSLPIAGVGPYGLGYIACGKGPVGEAAIAAIDAYLADDAHWAAFMTPWSRWLSPADFAVAVRSPVVRQAP